MEYIYLGDRLTRPELKKQACKAVRRPDGKCIRGKNGNMLVEFETGEKVVVLGRLLRKKKIFEKIRVNLLVFKEMIIYLRCDSDNDGAFSPKNNESKAMKTKIYKVSREKAVTIAMNHNCVTREIAEKYTDSELKEVLRQLKLKADF